MVFKRIWDFMLEGQKQSSEKDDWSNPGVQQEVYNCWLYDEQVTFYWWGDLGGGFKYFLFSPLLEEDSQFDYIRFFKGVETTN